MTRREFLKLSLTPAIGGLAMTAEAEKLRKKKMFDEELTKRGLTEKIYIDNAQNLLRRNFYADNINRCGSPD